jgi:membrane-anchored glycerophosphoryl diester phosphodiesterase (GDPDase)
MIAQRISAINLLRETFAAIGSLYATLLIMSSPGLIIAVLNAFGTLGSAGVALNVIYWFCAVPFLSGALTFYIYRSLTRNQVTVGEAFKQANRRLLQLILVNIMFGLLVLTGFIVLIIPGFYVLYRLIFSFYATVIDNTSALDSLSSSWELTKGRWWLVFRSTFLLSFVVFVPIVLISLLIDPTGKSLASQLVSSVFGFLVGPLMGVYFVLLYLRLRDSAATMK